MALLDLQGMEWCDDHDSRFGHSRDGHSCGSGLSLLLCGN
jgi:Lanthionine-containing peptide SapB precursor RamS